MIRALALGAVLGLVGCATPLQMGERLYREGDRLGALETWRAIPQGSPEYRSARERITAVEEEFQQLVVRYKKRASYFEERERLAESILNYRLALKLQPEDRATLEHVQQLARQLASRKASGMTSYREALLHRDLPMARRELDQLRTLDPFAAELESEAREFDLVLLTEVAQRLAAGRHAYASGNYGAARSAFVAVLRLDPDNETARGYLSYIAASLDEGGGSGGELEAFDPAAASDAEIRAEGSYQNGLAAERSGEPYAAIGHYERALEAHPDHREARNHLLAIRSDLAGEVSSLIEAGLREFRNEDLRPALDLWGRALLIDPDNERARAYIARAERQLGNLERLRSEPDVAAPED